MITPSKITVLGGAGFVGTALCRQFSKEGTPFEIVDLKSSRSFPEFSKIGDVRNLESLQGTITGGVVINLAAVHRDDVRDLKEYHRTNVEGASNIVKVCKAKGINRIVFTSSVAVYGFAEAGTGEDGPINPFNEYGRTKYQAEEVFRAWHEDTRGSLIIVRPTVIFGEGNRGNVYNLLSQIASGHFLMIGSGENKKSMAYVENVAAFLRESIKIKSTYSLFNYVDTPDMDMKTLVKEVRSTLGRGNGVGPRIPYSIGMLLGYGADLASRLSGKNLPISSVRVKKFCSTTSFKSAASSLPSFERQYTLEDGLRRTMHSEFIKPDSRREIFYTE